MSRFAVVLALGLLAANLVSADQPPPTTTTTPAVTVAVPATPVPPVYATTTFTPADVITTAPATPARRGLFSRIRNRGSNNATTMTTIPYSTAIPVATTGTTVTIPSTPVFSGTVVTTPGTVITNPGTIVPNPMPTTVPVPLPAKPVPSTTKPGGTSVIVPDGGTVVMAGRMFYTTGGVVPASGFIDRNLIPVNGTVTMTPAVTTAAYVVPATTTTTARRGLFGRLRNR